MAKDPTMTSGDPDSGSAFNTLACVSGWHCYLVGVLTTRGNTLYTRTML